MILSLSKIPLTNLLESFVEYFLEISTASSITTLIGVAGEKRENVLYRCFMW